MSTTSPSIQVLLELFDLHTNLFINVTEGVSAEDSNNRLQTKANHPSWIAGSITYQRFDLANKLNVSGQTSSNELFKDYKGIQENVTYPALTDYKSDWERISPLLKKALEQITQDQLQNIAPFDMGKPFTWYEALYFFIHREAYCIGQLGLWRRLLGYEAMKYPE